MQFSIYSTDSSYLPYLVRVKLLHFLQALTFLSQIRLAIGAVNEFGATALQDPISQQRSFGLGCRLVFSIEFGCLPKEGLN